MNKKLVLSALTAGIMLLLSSCGETIDVSPSNDPIQTTAKLTVVVKDEVTGDPITGASVTLLSTSKTETTAAGGIATFNDVYVGSHQLLVEGPASGYAKIVVSTSIDAESKENVHIAKEKAEVVNLPPLTASVSGYVYYTDKLDRTLPASNVSVRVQLTNTRFVDKVFKGETNAEGLYVISGLPAGAAFSAITDTTTIDGIKYSVQNVVSSGTLVASNTYHASLATLSTTANIFRVLDYPAIIELADVGAPITITFSDAANLEPAVYGNNTVTVTNQGADKAWSNGNKTLTLTPVGKWTGSLSVNISDLKSVNGKIISGNLAIYVREVDLSGEEVTGLVYNTTRKDTVTHNQGPVTLKWDALTGLGNVKYQVYSKSETGINYTAYGSPVESTEPVISTGVTVSLNQFTNKEVKLLVRAYNDQFETILDDANAVVIKDNEKPKTSSESQSYYPGTSTPDSAIAQVSLAQLGFAGTIGSPFQILNKTIYFNEVIDTSAVVFPAIASSPRLRMEHTWTIYGSGASAYSSLNLVLYVDPVASAGFVAPTGTLDERYVITGIEDLAGNSYEFIYNVGSPVESTRATNGLALRLYNAF
jgi:hypothetical protein